MGCGGSRADAIEPRYYESWTRETESTWLTNTDAETQQQVSAGGGGPEIGSAEAGLRNPGILEDSKSTQTCATLSSTASGIPTAEKRAHCGTQCTKPAVYTTGTLAQKEQNGFRTTEAKWESKKKVTKDVTINTTNSIRQINTGSNRRMTKNCIN